MKRALLLALPLAAVVAGASPTTSPAASASSTATRSNPGGTVFRLVGFDTPETVRAQCRPERDLGERATARLRDLVAERRIQARARALLLPGRDRGDEALQSWS